MVIVMSKIVDTFISEEMKVLSTTSYNPQSPMVMVCYDSCEDEIYRVEILRIVEITTCLESKYKVASSICRYDDKIERSYFTSFSYIERSDYLASRAELEVDNEMIGIEYDGIREDWSNKVEELKGRVTNVIH